MVREIDAMGLWVRSDKYSACSMGQVIEAAQAGCGEAMAIARATGWL